MISSNRLERMSSWNWVLLARVTIISIHLVEFEEVDWE